MKAIYSLCLLTLVLVACSTKEKQPNTENSGKSVNENLLPKDFQAKLEATQGAVLLDVRSPEEVSQGFIAGAKNIDFNSPDFQEKISALNKDEVYFVYCAAGKRSAKAADLMNQQGFKNLYTLEGGLNSWKENNLPVAQP